MFPFRYKLTLLVSALIISLLGVIFLIVQTVLEDEFIIEIKKDLLATDQLVTRLMEERWVSLNNQATILSVNRLVREIYTDKNLDKNTVNDLITNEVLPNFPMLSSLSVVSPEGRLLAADPLGQDVKDILIESGYIKTALAGETVSGHLFYRDIVLQLVGEPIFLREEFIGVLFVAVILDKRELDSISDISGAELLLFKDGKPFISSTWPMSMSRQMQLLAELPNFSSAAMIDRIEQVKLLGERYLYIQTGGDTEFMPRYLLSISLDRKLAFANNIYKEILFIGFIGVFIGIILSFLFARSISKPIQMLQEVTTDVENEDYKSRVNIQSNDEFSQLGKSFNKMLSGLEEKERIRSVMNKVVSKDIADVMLSGENKLGGEDRETTILFTDFRNFSRLSETMKPQDLLDFLNEYFTRASRVIDANYGVIDKYIGDALMALFGVPVSRGQDAYDAVNTALDIIEVLDEFNEEVAEKKGIKLEAGIGISTGKVVAGNIGAYNRLNYTVLGDEVNIASRLEGLTKYYRVPIIVSESTRQALDIGQCKDKIYFRCLDSVQVKGKSEGSLVFQVFTREQLTFENLASHVIAFERAHSMMLSREFEAAYKQFEQLTIDWPDDFVAEVFMERCDLYRQNADVFEKHYKAGVFVFDFK